MRISPERLWAFLLVAQFACIAAALPAAAGQIAARDGKAPIIGIGGVIEPGDEKTFHDLAKAMPNALVVLVGPGGHVGPALAIGLEIRARGLQTVVPPAPSAHPPAR